MKSISQKLMRNSFHFQINGVLASFMLSESVDVWSLKKKMERFGKERLELKEKKLDVRWQH